MKCPHCAKQSKAAVLETRKDEEGTVYRRRACGFCGKTFATKEVPTACIPETRKTVRKIDRRPVAYDFGPLSGVMR